MMDDPTNGKRFWTPADGGGKYRVYEQQVSAKHVDLAVEHYSNTIITSTMIGWPDDPKDWAVFNELVDQIIDYLRKEPGPQPT